MASKNFLINIADILKKTELIPSQPNNTEIDNKLEPRSLCKNSCINNEFFIFYFNLSVNSYLK